MKTRAWIILLGLPSFFAFQNCSRVGFSESASTIGKFGGVVDPLNPADTTASLSTNEDTPITSKAESASAAVGKPSTFDQLTSPSSGTLTAFDPATGSFTYTPNSHYFGQDQFQLTEKNPALSRIVTRTVVVQVARTGEPFILSDVFNFNMNTTSNTFTLQLGDNEDPNPYADLSADGSVTTMSTQYGVLSKTPNGFTYTPGKDFRGTDKVKFYARDGKGGLSSKDIKLITGNPLQAIQPGMAVRSANCIQCHAQISSNFVTDFGFGSSYYFAHDKGNPTSGDWIYSLRMASNSTSKQYYPDWITSAAFANGAQLIVPKADLGFKYATYAPSYYDQTMAWLQSTTIADLMTQIQAIPGSTFKATVVEKSSIYIGAPSIADIKTAGQLDAAHPLQYWKDSADQSYDFSGIALAASGGYYTNTATISCDGDLFIDGTVFLNAPVIKTISGCRLHATGVVFMQKGITFVTDPALQANANLQVVSPRAISMGIGLTHCEATTDPNGWYNVNKVASPMVERFQSLVSQKDVITRNTDSTSGFPMTSASPAAEGAYIVGEAQKIAGLEDASCHGRNVAFERLLLVAPQIHSRYKGNFSGVVIGEYPMFSLQSFVYQFDQTFLKVPVLPLMNMDKILSIQ